MEYGFTQRQIEAVTKLVEALYNGNNKVGSIVKNEKIEMFKDADNNFYISFYSKMAGELAGSTTTIYYMQIDSFGVRTNLNEKHDSFYLIELFSTLEPITL